MVGEARKLKKKLLFKVDFQKVYDFVIGNTWN